MDLEFKDFWLLQEDYIEEVEGLGRVFQHQRTGIKVISINNQDPHKVFAIAFHTPPKDNKGTAHIVEHTVCCASQKYPLKETFMAFEKGSICTTLNACTYPDMTMYYGASLSEKDLTGIMSVYMDMVFHPLMCEATHLFKQEGWHYTLEEDEMEISGVVYHEMLGEYGEASTRLEHMISEALFPNTPYRFDSGGVPQEIIKLSYDEMMAFYQEHYTPDQGVIYLYGDFNLTNMLEVIATLQEKEAAKEVVPERLYHYATSIYQPPLQQPIQKVGLYPGCIEEEKQTYMSLSFVIDTVLDPELRLAFELLEHMLLRSSASPLAKALVVERDLGVSLGEGGYDTSRYQPVFSIQLKGAHPDQGNVFEKVVLETLTDLVRNGIDQELIYAALHTLTFELREIDASYDPVGLQYGEMILSNYLYGGEPFAHLKYREPVARIKVYSQKGYFEALIKKYLLDNTHRVLAVLNPSDLLEADEQAEVKMQIDEYVASLTSEGKAQLIEEVETLEALQMMQNSKEDLKCLPELKKSDIAIQVPTIEIETINTQPFKGYFQAEETKGICYLHVLFNTQSVAQEDLVYLALLGHLLTYVGLVHKDYAQLENEINSLTGGLNCSLQAYSDIETGKYVPYLKISSKVLVEEVSRWRQLMHDILTKSIFTEKAKIKEIIGNIQYELGRSFEGAPEYRATRRVFAFFAPAGQYEDQVSGMRFYEFIKAFYQAFETRYEDVMAQVVRIYKQIIAQNNLLIYMTASQDDKKRLVEEITYLSDSLPKCDMIPCTYDLTVSTKREAYCTLQKVNAIAKGFNYADAGYYYHGSMEVATQIIESTYLWNCIRLQGGAYGCDLMMSRDGHLVACSYCDPKLKSTLDTFNGIGKFLRELTLEEEELERYIIHTMGALQVPISMEQKSERGLMYLLCGMSSKQLENIMLEVHQTTLEDIKALAPLFEDFAKAPYLCVVGSQKQIKKHKKYFESIID